MSASVEPDDEGVITPAVALAESGKFDRFYNIVEKRLKNSQKCSDLFPKFYHALNYHGVVFFGEKPQRPFPFMSDEDYNHYMIVSAFFYVHNETD